MAVAAVLSYFYWKRVYLYDGQMGGLLVVFGWRVCDFIVLFPQFVLGRNLGGGLGL